MTYRPNAIQSSSTEKPCFPENGLATFSLSRDELTNSPSPWLQYFSVAFSGSCDLSTKTNPESGKCGDRNGEERCHYFESRFSGPRADISITMMKVNAYPKAKWPKDFPANTTEYEDHSTYQNSVIATLTDSPSHGVSIISTFKI
jgi:hypothetical protein